jgi:hypothetical protein
MISPVSNTQAPNSALQPKQSAPKAEAQTQTQQKSTLPNDTVSLKSTGGGETDSK